MLLFLTATDALAGSATWNLNPTNGDWNTAGNWTPATVPNGSADTATFDVSNTSAVALSAATEVKTIVFNSGASPFTITAGPFLTLTVSNAVNGVGIINNSGVTQTFVTADLGSIHFTNGANAGDQNAFINNGGAIEFSDFSDAGSSTFTNNGGSANGTSGGEVQFEGVSGAEAGTFINNGGTAGGALGGVTSFIATAFANNSTLIANGGSGGGHGGSITFSSFVNGGTARVEVFGDGNLDISLHLASGGVTLGSIEGDGIVFLGDRKLTVGSNNLSTTFSGIIQDGGLGGGSGGQFIKIGAGSLTLTNGNTYTRGTIINGGELGVTNTTGSATGSSRVQVNTGTLGGSGIIAGAVTVGTGSGAGAFLEPAFASNKKTTLTLQSSLTLEADATYTYTFKARNSESRTDLVVANGVTINGATIAFQGKTQGTLTTGTVLTVLSNTSANPISGTFSNLADGAIVTVNGNKLQASYTGGDDGNDLTLTVVP